MEPVKNTGRGSKYAAQRKGIDRSVNELSTGFLLDSASEWLIRLIDEHKIRKYGTSVVLCKYGRNRHNDASRTHCHDVSKCKRKKKRMYGEKSGFWFGAGRGGHRSADFFFGGLRNECNGIYQSPHDSDLIIKNTISHTLL